MRATIRPVARLSTSSSSLSERRETKAHSQSRGECVRLAAMDEAHCSPGSRALEIETPSWGYGNSGTRFHVFPWPGAARDAWERIADAALVHRLTGCCPTVALHIPWDRVDDWAELARASPRSGASASARSTRTSSATTTTGSAASATPTRRVRAEGARPLPRVRRDRAAGRLDGDQPLARRRHELPGPGRPRAARYAPADRRARGALRGAAARDAAARRVQVLRAGLLQHRPPRLGHGCAGLPPARAAGAGARRHRAPPAGHEHRADRRAAARRGPARRLPLQQPQVRRRRPDRRRDRPVRALPDHARDRLAPTIRRPPRRPGSRVHDRPVAQRRGQDRRDDPVGRRTSRPPTRRRCSSTRSGSRRRRPRATCSGRTGCCSRRSRPTCGRCSRGCASGSASRPTPSRRSAPAGYARAARAERGTARVESAYERSER